jgi:hypothetical protein
VYVQSRSIVLRDGELTGTLGHTDLRDQFLAVSRKKSPEQRTVRAHLTASTVRALRPILYRRVLTRGDQPILQDWDGQVVAAVVTDVLQVVLMNNLRMAKVVS